MTAPTHNPPQWRVVLWMGSSDGSDPWTNMALHEHCGDERRVSAGLRSTPGLSAMTKDSLGPARSLHNASVPRRIEQARPDGVKPYRGEPSPLKLVVKCHSHDRFLISVSRPD